MKMTAFITILVLLAISASAAIGSEYASEVISYSAGTNAVWGYDDDPSVSLGEPSRTAPTWDYTSTQDVTMFAGPWEDDQIISIGAGGSLVVKFDHQILDNTAGTVWGYDFIVFGNVFFVDSSYPNGVANGGLTGTEPARISVSQNGTDWHEVTDAFADVLFPTQGYMDTSVAQGNDGTIPTDFTRPVRPDLQYDGWAYADILEYYETSGGGAPVDFHSTGLAWIQYVKIHQDAGDGWSAEIDALSDVAVPLDGDFDMDGDVDGQDFLDWNLGYGTSYAKRSDGDSNGDAIIDGTDFLNWNLSYGMVPSSAPEPTTACLLMVAGSVWLRRRRQM